MSVVDTAVVVVGVDTPLVGTSVVVSVVVSSVVESPFLHYSSL